MYNNSNVVLTYQNEDKMNYRTIKSTGTKVSILGFGMMRLPIIGNDVKNINKKEATKMVRTAIDAGVNYIDTAYPYHGEMSELFTGEVLLDGYREKVNLATKLPMWLIKSKKDAEHYFNLQLERLKTNHIDFYLFHALNQEHWNTIKNNDLLAWIEEKKTSGKIKHAGFSFHADLDLFKEIIDAYQWDFCQIQYNFMNENYQAGKEGLHYAAQKDIAVIIMEPLYGGKLAQTPPPTVQNIWEQSSMLNQTPPQRALNWLWDQPEVTLLLSGMSNFNQVQENISHASNAKSNNLNEVEKQTYKKVEAEYNRIMPIPCTDCKYCLPCPENVNIPSIFSLYNQGIAYNVMEDNQKFYHTNMPAETHADNCIACGQCESQCPQNIEIIEWLNKAEAALA